MAQGHYLTIQLWDKHKQFEKRLKFITFSFPISDHQAEGLLEKIRVSASLI